MVMMVLSLVVGHHDGQCCSLYVFELTKGLDGIVGIGVVVVVVVVGS